MSRGNRSRPAHERTAEERERDREERARRRAGRSSEDRPATAPAETPVAVSPQHETGEQPQPEPTVAVAAQDIASDPPATAEPPAPVGPEGAAQDPAPAEPPAPAESHAPAAPEQPAPTVERDPPAEQLAPVEQLAPEASVPAETPVASPPGMPPQRARRQVPLTQRAGSPDIEEPSGRGLGPRAKRRRGRPPPGASMSARRLTRARGAALLALAAAVVLVWFLLSLFQPFAGAGSSRVIVEIPKGSSSSKIGSILSHDGVVSSGFFFNLRALLEGKHGSLHSGRFQLTRGMSYSAAIDALSKPPPKVIAIKVVIPEGYTRRQIADLVAEDELTGNYLADTKGSPLLNLAHYGAPRVTPDLEGFLFPATYELSAGTPVSRLVDEQLLAFRERFTSEDIRRAHELHVTPYELLTVASMIEREAQTEHDRPLIAAVIYNRLRDGIPLGIDATIYYAVELQKGIATYTGELTESQLKTDSPYNTRLHKGVPPTPISNPGSASIEAAAHPAHVPYLYYVAAADGCGEQAFSSTYAQFQKNVAEYQAAVKKNGGHPPSCKKK